MLMLLLAVSSVVASPVTGHLAEVAGDEVRVSVDGGLRWSTVHRCGALDDPPPDDHADSLCASLAVAWQDGALYIDCPADGQYRWTPADDRAAFVTEPDAATIPCSAPAGAAGRSRIDTLTRASVYGTSPPALAPPRVDVAALARRARRAAWLPRLSIGVTRERGWSVAPEHWRTRATTEVWVFLSWDLDRNQHLTIEGITK